MRIIALPKTPAALALLYINTAIARAARQNRSSIVVLLVYSSSPSDKVDNPAEQLVRKVTAAEAVEELEKSDIAGNINLASFLLGKRKQVIIVSLWYKLSIYILAYIKQDLTNIPDINLVIKRSRSKSTKFDKIPSAPLSAPKS